MDANNDLINYKFVGIFIFLILFNIRMETNTSKGSKKLRNNNTFLSKQKSKDDNPLTQQTYFYNPEEFNYMHDYNYNEYYEKKLIIGT